MLRCRTPKNTYGSESDEACWPMMRGAQRRSCSGWQAQAGLSYVQTARQYDPLPYIPHISQMIGTCPAATFNGTVAP